MPITTEQRRNLVVDLSVYNALSFALRRDATVRELVNVLHAAWTPAWDDVATVITTDTVQDAAQRLCERGIIGQDDVQQASFCGPDRRLFIPTRGANGLGPPVGMSEDRQDLMWRGKR